MGKVSRDTKTLRKNQKEMVEIKKHTVPEIINALDGLIIRLEMAKERISKLEEMSIETSKTEIQWEKNWKRQNWISKNCETITKGIIYL